MNNAIESALSRLLRPLVRILLRYGVSYAEFAEIAKRSYIQSADKDFALPGRKSSVSRIAVLTGLNRKEVTRLRNELAPETKENHYNRGRRIISGWFRDAEYLDDSGEPRAIPIEGPISFTQLVKKYSGDMPVRAVMDELMRVGAIKKNPQDEIVLANGSAYVPSADKDAMFHYVGGAATDLISNLDFNLEATNGNKRLQLTTSYDNLSSDSVKKFRKFGPAQAREFLRHMDEWLAEHDRDASDQDKTIEGGERMRAGFGVYYIEETLIQGKSS